MYSDASSSQRLCSFFPRGVCRYGGSCRFVHSFPQQQGFSSPAKPANAMTTASGPSVGGVPAVPTGIVSVDGQYHPPPSFQPPLSAPCKPAKATGGVTKATGGTNTASRGKPTRRGANSATKRKKKAQERTPEQQREAEKQTEISELNRKLNLLDPSRKEKRERRKHYVARQEAQKQQGGAQGQVQKPQPSLLPPPPTYHRCHPTPSHIPVFVPPDMEGVVFYSVPVPMFGPTHSHSSDVEGDGRNPIEFVPDLYCYDEDGNFQFLVPPSIPNDPRTKEELHWEDSEAYSRESIERSKSYVMKPESYWSKDKCVLGKPCRQVDCRFMHVTRKQWDGRKLSPSATEFVPSTLTSTTKAEEVENPTEQESKNTPPELLEPAGSGGSVDQSITAPSPEAKERFRFWSAEQFHRDLHTKNLFKLVSCEYYCRLQHCENLEDASSNDVLVEALKKECARVYENLYGYRTRSKSTVMVADDHPTLAGRNGRIVALDAAKHEFEVEFHRSKTENIVNKTNAKSGVNDDDTYDLFDVDTDAGSSFTRLKISAYDLALPEIASGKGKDSGNKIAKNNKSASQTLRPAQCTLNIEEDESNDIRGFKMVVRASTLNELAGLDDSATLAHRLSEIMQEGVQEEGAARAAEEQM